MKPRDYHIRRIEALSPVLLAGLALLALFGPEAKPRYGSAAWPSLSHPLGIDSVGRDFLAVLAEGVADFVIPGVLAVGILFVVIAVRLGLALLAPVLPEEGEAEAPSGLAGASPPRLLLVLVGMLLLEEPSPLVAAAIVLVLYLPVALNEVTSRLADLRDQEILAGALAHGLPLHQVLFRYLIGGYVKEHLARHGAALFTQVAFTQIALSYLFGASSVQAGLGTSWGMEFRRLAPNLPGPQGFFCPSAGVCEPAVSAFQAGVLLVSAIFLLGGLLRLAQDRMEAIR